MNYIKTLLLFTTTALFIGCGATADILSTPIENIDTSPLKEVNLTDEELKHWGHLDLIKDTIPGMSVDKAYTEIIKNRKGKKVIVAVIDSGVDINHEDLESVIWTNSKEKPNNGKDDDKNGYVDDIHGWNFLGDTYYEQLEYVRLVASGNSANPRYIEAKTELDNAYQKALSAKNKIEKIIKQVDESDKAVATHLNKDNYTKEDVFAIKTEDVELLKHVTFIKQMFVFGLESISDLKAQLTNELSTYTESLNYNLNTNFNGRITGDNPDDFTQVVYGNNNVRHIKKDESHGTHVAGIIGAIRNNDIGINGVANNVELMILRAVPNGDEYDKDIYLAIKYAVDNGAQVINTSFGKYYSPHSAKVREAIAYASQNDVVIVNAAGNESEDLDKKQVYPNDAVGIGPEVSDTFISVGALNPEYGSEMIANYSNYGKINVDIFAPGSKIYSTFPENEYKSIGGTSFASPAVAGIAALIRSYYPKLTASQVKDVILKSGLPIQTKVIIGGSNYEVKSFNEICKSGRIANAYNALIFASKLNSL